MNQVSITTPLYPQFNQPTKKIKRITRTVEKYSPSGEYLGREIITEDVEDIEVPDYTWRPTNFDQYPITISDTTHFTIN